LKIDNGELKITDEGVWFLASIIDPQFSTCIVRARKELSAVLKIIVAVLLLLPTLAQAQKLEQIVAEAKKEGEVTLVASASTFGGKKGFADLEALFAKRYGFKGKLNLVGGPSFPQMAGRIITEQKAGTKASTDLYLGSDGTYVTMHQEKALQKLNWSGTFPWITKAMEIFPQESVLVYDSFHGIIYNSNVIPKDKAPKNYDDLIDPAQPAKRVGL
jgi:ABC-type uncharacterized transport system YnjBCD substrate-binding protein